MEPEPWPGKVMGTQVGELRASTEAARGSQALGRLTGSQHLLGEGEEAPGTLLFGEEEVALGMGMGTWEGAASS
jgi:hypothetical protein